MKKRVLFLGLILSVVNIVKAETGMNEDVKARFEKNEGSIQKLSSDSVKRIKEVAELANSNLKFNELNNRNLIAVNQETEVNTTKTKVNETNITETKAETVKNKESIVKIGNKFDKHEKVSDLAIKQLKDQDEKLKEADKKFAKTDERLGEADKKFQETDKELIKADARIEANVKGLQKHDDAVYETIGTTRDVNAKAVKVIKADINRDRIIVLENQTKSVVTNEDDIADNKTNISNNTTNIADNKTNITNNRNEIEQEKVKTNNNTKAISSNRNQISNNSERIGTLEGNVDGLEREMKKGFAMSAAMSSIDFQVLDVGDAGFGFGVGNYKNSEAISLGVGVRPTENMTLNIKGAMSTGKGQETMVGGGAVYKFNLFGV